MFNVVFFLIKIKCFNQQKEFVVFLFFFILLARCNANFIFVQFFYDKLRPLINPGSHKNDVLTDDLFLWMMSDDQYVCAWSIKNLYFKVWMSNWKGRGICVWSEFFYSWKSHFFCFAKINIWFDWWPIYCLYALFVYLFFRYYYVWNVFFSEIHSYQHNVRPCGMKCFNFRIIV